MTRRLFDVGGRVWISVEVKTETDKAICVDHGLGTDTWIPKSQIMDYSDDYVIGDVIEIELPEWFAIKKDML